MSDVVNREPTHPVARAGWLLARHRIWLEVSTLVAVITYAYIASLQWREMKETVDQARRTAAATETAYRTGYRAWLGPSGEQAFQLLDEHGRAVAPQSIATLAEGQRYVVKLALKNTGPSPALNVRHRTAVAFTNTIPSEARDRAAFQNATIAFPSSVLEFHSELSAPIEINAQRRRAVSRPGHEPGLFVAATVCYEDIFGASHYSRFCRVLGPNLPGEFSFCENDAIDSAPDDARMVCRR